MPDELCRFQTTGLSWAERAGVGELHAVLSPQGTERRNRFLHAVHTAAAAKAAALVPPGGRVVDFGCGTGRFVRFFQARGYSVLGTEITPEMIAEAHRFGVPAGAIVELTDGVHIPAADASVDLVWVCGVLRFSLLVPDPVYADIAREMYRVLKPGGYVVNVEVYVDNPPAMFTKDFERAGFRTVDVRVLNRHFAGLEKRLQSERLPVWAVRLGGSFVARFRCLFDEPGKPAQGVRDYLFTWHKSKA
jgi:SAM-dependent methyltransferase